MKFLKSNFGKTAGNTALIGTIYAFLRFGRIFAEMKAIIFLFREAQIYAAIAFIVGCVLMYRRIKSQNILKHQEV